MTHSHACVWIDHREARIVALSADSADTTVIHDHQESQVNRKSDHMGLGKVAADHLFFDEIAEALKPFTAILIAGPGNARTELSTYLTEHAPLVAKSVLGVEPMDHPSEGELVAAARKYFEGADRMRA